MRSIPAIRVRQWLEEWGKVPTDPDKFQSPPPREFYVTSIRAADLKALSAVYPRDASTGRSRSEDPYVQRNLVHDRTSEIRDYIRVGFPLSSLGKRRMDESERNSLRKPGWLPTAIVANLVPAGDVRDGRTLESNDAMKITATSPDSNLMQVELPPNWTDVGWKSESGVPPLEIIDGQHRLSAFAAGQDDNFELPVVIFDGLDFSWQAYLFWTINIKPKRINASLAYDLYPLLREQDWLEAGESLAVYRETRAQEIVETLWSSPESIWRDRINMLGQPGMRATRPVTQSAFVRSLASSFVRPFHGYKGLGGLFGGTADGSGFDWPRGQQAAFIVFAWNSLATAIAQSEYDWSQALRDEDLGLHSEHENTDPRLDPAVVGQFSLLASDQGVRAFHMVVNDMFYLGAQELKLEDWAISGSLDDSSEELFRVAWDDLSQNSIGGFLQDLAAALAGFDWRNSRAESLSRAQRIEKQALRGTGGYNVLRDQILEYLATVEDDLVRVLASRVTAARHG